MNLSPRAIHRKCITRQRSLNRRGSANSMERTARKRLHCHVAERMLRRKPELQLHCAEARTQTRSGNRIAAGAAIRSLNPNPQSRASIFSHLNIFRFRAGHINPFRHGHAREPKERTAKKPKEDRCKRRESFPVAWANCREPPSWKSRASRWRDTQTRWSRSPLTPPVAPVRSVPILEFTNRRPTKAEASTHSRRARCVWIRNRPRRGQLHHPLVPGERQQPKRLEIW